MILIPGGTAIIGSDEQEIVSLAQTWNVSVEMFRDETPQTMAPLDSFYLDQYEVTNEQYKAFVEATRYPPPLHWTNGMYPEGTAAHPVTYVSWDDAQAYAQWAGKRLPTAEEWEAAARGLQGQTYPWGSTFAGKQLNLGNITGGPAPVGTYPDDVSPYQVYDMGGNVMEWTLTQYQGQHDFFILKGGAWSSDPFEARGANNTPGEAIYQLGHIGFRCAKSVGSHQSGD
jgi:formylglycine-generating enzyme required for sulfatase activity